jgi:flagellar hook-length control protein FliK
MALTPTPTHAPAASKSAASALPGLQTRAKSRLAGDDDDTADFASQLERARPDEKSPDASTATRADDATPQAQAKPAQDKDATPDAAAQAQQQQQPQQAELGALQWAQQQLAAANAGKATVKGDATGLGKGGVDALRKGALAGKDAAADAALAATAGQDAKAALGKGGAAAADPDAGLGQGQGAGNSASDTRDSLAAFLPQADAALPVQAGAIGANPGASLEANAAQASAATPAQATLAMPPQSPAFAPALGQQIEVWMREGVQHAEVQLNPQELGPIRVKIAIEGGATRIDMHADVASTRDALQQALPQLSDSLGQVGLALTGGGVSDQSASQSQAQSAFGDGGQGGRPGATRSGTGGDGGGDTLAGAAAAARPAAQRRGLLDAYA